MRIKPAKWSKKTVGQPRVEIGNATQYEDPQTRNLFVVVSLDDIPNSHDVMMFRRGRNQYRLYSVIHGTGEIRWKVNATPFYNRKGDERRAIAYFGLSSEGPS